MDSLACASGYGFTRVRVGLGFTRLRVGLAYRFAAARTGAARTTLEPSDR
jgi:hypothetical protein